MTARSRVVIVLLLLAGTASADYRRDVVPSPWKPGQLDAAGAIPYRTVFLNRCASGCPVTGPAVSNSINNTWGINGPHTLTAFPFDDATWNNVVACVNDVFDPFLIDVVDTDPGTAPHFEVMVGGQPTDIGERPTLLGVAPGGCTSTYMDNALVFAFATRIRDYYGFTTCGPSCVDAICWTAAQELGHVWASMDHVTVPADPMTYFDFQGRRYFQNVDAQCGSDCRNGFSPDGLACTGQNHRCLCTESQTQNSYETIGGLFGFGPSTPPTVTFVGLSPGQSVTPGVAVTIDANDDSGLITKVELVVDGVLAGMLTLPPFVIAAPDTLQDGTHHFEAFAYDAHQAKGRAVVDVVVGRRCDGDCASATDVCIGGRCVAGSEVDGGLGTSCTQPSDCISNHCASDGTDMYCGEPCLVGQCPSGFGCLDTDDGALCSPGYDDGAGCGCRSSGDGGPAVFVLLLVVTRLTRRRS